MKYDITDFGARRGEDAPQTGAIQAAIDACFLAGGGEVVVPEGAFLTGPLTGFALEERCRSLPILARYRVLD